jgi:asparagine synthase (glutamine-hydrolysing)
MCGIIGFLGSSITDLEFQKARDCLIHRGPDDGGIWRDTANGVILGHRRLAILDLSSQGNQPMISQCQRYSIVFNGEVYNFIELKDELLKLGYTFNGSGDTEVVLASYIEWGEESLKRFNGMFSLAIWDKGSSKERASLFMARDRAGKKPFYFTQYNGEFFFASELKAIPPQMRSKINFKALNLYLAMGYIPGNICIAEGVQKLPAAHAARYFPREKELNVWRWWSLPEYKPATGAMTGNDFAENSWELLLDSVRLRQRSDVPMGVFLSGGLDSSLITAAVAATSSRAVSTFTIGIPGSKIDESTYAKQIANHFETEHHFLPLPGPSLDFFEQLFPFIDEPLADSSIIPTFIVSMLTRKHVTVAMGGDGGDEIFGGYRHYQQVLFDQSKFGWIPESVLKASGYSATLLPSGIKGRNRLSSYQNGIEKSYIYNTPYFDKSLRQRLLSPQVNQELAKELSFPEQFHERMWKKDLSAVDNLMRMDFQSLMADGYLVKIDRASMANSLEIRNPFLDFRLVEYAYHSIPTEWKCTTAERRKVQNLMARKYLPNNYDFNRKQGFSIPIDNWLQKIDVKIWLDLLPSDIFDKREVERLISGLKKGRKNGARIFCLISLVIAMKNLGWIDA